MGVILSFLYQALFFIVGHRFLGLFGIFGLLGLLPELLLLLPPEQPLQHRDAEGKADGEQVPDLEGQATSPSARVSAAE